MLLSVQKPTRLMEFRTTGRKFSSLPVQINVASTTDNAKKTTTSKNLLPPSNFKCSLQKFVHFQTPKNYIFTYWCKKFEKN